MQLIAIKKYNAFCSLIIVSITEIEFIFLKLIEIWEICVSVVITGISLFISLVFNEFIEINCFGLNKKTKKNLEIIAQLESQDQNDYNEDNKIQVDIGDYKYELGFGYDDNNKEDESFNNK